jgi:hypothetical protein
MRSRLSISGLAAPLLLLVAVGTLLLSACGGGSPAASTGAQPTASTKAAEPPAQSAQPPAKAAPTQAPAAAANSPAAASTLDACSFLTAQEVQAVIGKAVVPVTDSSDPRGLGCSYHDASSNSRLVSYAVYPLSPSQAKQVHELTKGGGRDQIEVAGIGEDAYWDETFDSLNVLQGRYAVSLAVSDFDADEPLEVAEELVSKLLARLP